MKAQISHIDMPQSEQAQKIAVYIDKMKIEQKVAPISPASEKIEPKIL